MGDEKANERAKFDKLSCVVLPPRWLRCPRKANGLVFNKFLAFKTPLGANFNSVVPPSCSFTVDLLLSSLKNRKTKVGLCVDVTGKEVLYESSRFSDHGVKYIKLGCGSDGVPPTPEQTTAFVRLCDQFISLNPLEIIGVHCTHGFNRTGFLLVAYLVEKGDWSLDRALYEFSRWRPPGVFDQAFLEELHRRYGDETETIPSAPPQPDWWYDEDGSSSIDSQATAVVDPSKIVSSATESEVLDSIRGIVEITKEPTLQQILGKCRKLLGCENESVGVQAWTEVDSDNIKQLCASTYMAAWIAGGARCKMLVDGVDQVFLVDQRQRVFRAPNLRFPKRKDPNGHVKDTILDGEVIIETVNNRSIARFIIFDIAKFGGGKIEEAIFYARLDCIWNEIISPRSKAILKGQINKAAEPLSVRLKGFADVNKIDSFFTEETRQALGHEPRALLFHRRNEPYSSLSSSCQMLWKVEKGETVNFRVQHQETPTEDGSPPASASHLYVVGEGDPFCGVDINEELEKLDGQTIECRFDGISNVWKFVRVAKEGSELCDRTTAERVQATAHKTVAQEDLVQYIRTIAQQRKSDAKLMPPPPSPKTKRRASSPHTVPRYTEDGFAIPAPPTKAPRLSS